MKIAYIYTALTTFGGVDRIITNKANYFADKLGYEVYIITDSQVGRAPVFPLSSKVKHIDLDIDFDKQYHHRFFIRAFYYFYLMAIYKKRLQLLLKRNKFNIVITTCGRDLDFLTKINDGSIKIGEIHTTRKFSRNFHLLEEKGFLYKQIAKFWRRKQEKAISNLDAFVTLTKQDADSWKDINPNTYYIANPIFKDYQEKSLLNNKKAIAVGRLDVEKGFDKLIDAWNIVSKKHPDWQLDIYGGGLLKEKLNNQITSLNLKENCTIHQPSKDIFKDYLDSSICIMSSKFEGFGLVLIEAMSCGVPCVSFNCPYGPANIIKDHEDGILVEPGNIEELANSINYLIENEQTRLLYGNNAIKNIQRFSSEAIINTWVELFKSISNHKAIHN